MQHFIQREAPLLTDVIMTETRAVIKKLKNSGYKAIVEVACKRNLSHKKVKKQANSRANVDKSTAILQEYIKVFSNIPSWLLYQFGRKRRVFQESKVAIILLLYHKPDSMMSHTSRFCSNVKCFTIQ